MRSKILAIKHAVRGAPARPLTDASRGIDRWGGDFGHRFERQET
jgi:hypothetical protein